MLAGKAIGCSVLAALWLAKAAWASEVALPPPATHGPLALESALAQRQSQRSFRAEALTLAQVGQLLWAAQGVTRSNGRRTAPSAGALYPLEVYLLAGRVKGVSPGVYRYLPAGHRLLPVLAGELRPRLAAASLGQASLRQAPAILLLSGEVARTAQKYGERAERYMWLEAGHAGQNIALQAQALGLGAVMVGAFDDRAVQQALGLPAAHAPLALLPVGRP